MTELPAMGVPYPRVQILTETYAQADPNETPAARGQRLIEHSDKIVAALAKRARRHPHSKPWPAYGGT